MGRAHAETMSHEIEAKIKVASLEPIEDKLKELDADFVQSVQQVDTYFMDTHEQLRKDDCGLRIRQEITEGQTTARVAFKGPHTDSQFKSRPEYETDVGDAEIAEKIFELLGYHKGIVIEKKRGMWLLDSCEVCLDELPELGCFVEVEGPNENVISSVLKKLNLQNEPHIPHGYASMMSRKLKQE